MGGMGDGIPRPPHGGHDRNGDRYTVGNRNNGGQPRAEIPAAGITWGGEHRDLAALQTQNRGFVERRRVVDPLPLRKP